MAITPLQIDYIMVHLLRDEKVIQKALGRVDPNIFNPIMERNQHVLWLMAKSYWTTYKQVMTDWSVLSYHSEIFGQEMSPDTFHYFQHLMSVPVQSFNSNNAIKLLGQFLVDRKVISELNALDRELPSNKLSQVLDDLKQKLVTSQFSVIPEHSPCLLDFNRPLTPVRTFHTSIDWLDEVAGGSFMEKQLYGFIAPSGGGKSTLSRQLAGRMSQTGQHVSLLSYEEKVSDMMYYRIWSSQTGIPSSRFERLHTLGELSPEEKKKLENLVSPAAPYLHLYDMSESCNGIDDLRVVFAEDRDKGRLSKLYILDWIGVAVDKYMDKFSIKPDAKRNCLNNFATQLQSIVDEFEVTIMACHQLQNQAAKRAASARVPKHQESADSAGLSHLMSMMFTMGNLDKQGMAKFSSAKNRHRASSEILIKLQGDIGKFVRADDYTVLHGRAVKKEEVGRVSAKVKEAEMVERFGGI